MAIDKIQTSRLLLTPFSIDDDEFVFELLNTEGWIQFIGNRNINSKDDAKAYIKKVLTNPNMKYWTVRLKAESKPIGIVTLIKRDYLEHYDIGTAFLPLFTKNGYAYEAMRTILYHLNDPEEHSFFLAITAINNGRSMRLLSKLEFQFSKQIVVEDETLMVYQVSTDQLSISEITDAFFNVFTNKGKNAELDALKNICHADALFSNINKPGISVSNLSSFIKARKVLLADGTLREFEEKEICYDTRIFHSMAVRCSEYQKSGILNEKHFVQKGKKIFQFIKDGTNWKIHSVVWEDEDA